MKVIKNSYLIKESKIPILVCFPFAGGGASAYRNWVKYFNERVIVCPVQMPGREERIMDKCYIDMNDLIEELFEAMKPFMKYNIFLFGHSLGAKIAFELEKKLECNNFKSNHLIVSASRAPCIDEPDKIYDLEDNEFIKRLSEFGGTPKEILENKQLIKFFLPMLRADFILDERYYLQDDIKVDCPITAFGGYKDETVKFEYIEEWKKCTNKEFKLKKFRGGHFFIKEAEKSVLKEVERIIFNY